MNIPENQKLNFEFPIRPYLLISSASDAIKEAHRALRREHFIKCEFYLKFAEDYIKELTKFCELKKNEKS